MRYLIFLSLILVGCESADHYGVKIGDMVTLNSGFYRGCTGIITDYSEYDSMDDQISLTNVVCKNVTMNYLRTAAKNLEK